jgi:hypothetical protein
VRSLQLLLACGTGALLAACAGSGEGLDENGRPLDDPAAPLTAEFASIQAHIFAPRCIGCHAGAAAPLGMRLTEDAAYASIVNAPSVEQPSLKRIAPGSPDASYLIQKVSGTASVGGRMPLGGPPLTSDEINALRQWVLDGAAAPRGTVTSSGLIAAPAQLAAVMPMQSARVEFQMGAVVVSASAELDAFSLHDASITLLASGGDGGFAEGNEVAIAPLTIEVRSDSPSVIAIAPPGPWVPDRYRLTITGDGSLPVRDRGTLPIDGDRDSQPGGDFVLQFDIAPESVR